MKPTPRKLILCLAGIVLCLLGFKRFLGAGGNALAVFYLKLSPVAWAALILISALSVGLAVLRWTRLRPRGSGAAALFGVGLGLGLISLAALGLGAAGFCGRTALGLMLLVFLLIGLRDLFRILRILPTATQRVRKAPIFQLALWGVLACFLVLNLIRAYAPPYDYDSLEYHVAAPAAYDRAGRVVFLRDNVYANFPQNCEMLYFLAMRLTKSPDQGAAVGRMLGTAMGFLAALALYRMLRGVAGKEAGLIGAAFFYTWPGVTVYSGMPYVELPLIFYGVLALWALVWSVRRKLTRPGPRGWVMLAGMAAGLAMGVKYTAALLVLLPLLGWTLFTWVTPRIPGREAARRAALLVGVALLFFSPWMVRNTINTRNPVYPLLYKVFDNSNWDEQKDARWTHAHSPHKLSLKKLPKELSEHAQDVLFYNQENATMLLVLFIPFCLLATRRTRMICLWLAVHATLLFLLYFFFTQRNSRFLDVGVPVLAALSALGAAATLRSRPARVLRPILILLLFMAPSRARNYYYAWLSSGVALGAESQADCLRRFNTLGAETPEEYLQRWNQDFGPYANMQYLNDLEHVPEGSKILFIGEAQTFYCRRDYVASTVFDSHLIEQVVGASTSPAEVRDRLKAEGITHIYVDTPQLYRLQTTYRYPFRGREYLGMLDGFNWALFDHFAKSHLRLLKTFQGQSAAAFSWSRWEEFRATHEKAKAAKRPLGGHFAAVYEVK